MTFIYLCLSDAKVSKGLVFILQEKEREGKQLCFEMVFSISAFNFENNFKAKLRHLKYRASKDNADSL